MLATAQMEPHLYRFVQIFRQIFLLIPFRPITHLHFYRILESKSEKYPKGSIILHHGGWQTVCKVKDNSETIWYACDKLLPPNQPVTVAVGAMGMPGWEIELAMWNSRVFIHLQLSCLQEMDVRKECMVSLWTMFRSHNFYRGLKMSSICVFLEQPFVITHCWYLNT